MKLAFSFWFLLFFCLNVVRISGQPAGQKAVPLTQGSAWLVDEKWFEKNPPFLDFYKIGQEQGLKANGSISILLQDSRGFIWLSNRDSWGLFRYDGHEFKRFSGSENPQHQLDTKEITCMLEDETGVFWLATDLGLTRFDPKTAIFHTFFNNIDSTANITGEVFLQKNGQLWYGTEKGSFLFNRKTEQFENAVFAKISDATDPARHAEANIGWVKKAAFETPDGLIWSWGKTPLGNGLLSINLATHEIVLFPLRNTPLYRNNRVNPIDYDPWYAAFLADKKGENLWLSGWRGGLRRFNLKSKTWTQFAQNYVSSAASILPDLECTLQLAEAADGKFWLTSANGLIRFDPVTLRFEAWQNRGKDAAELPKLNFASGMLLDRENRLWVATDELFLHDPKVAYFQRRPLDWTSIERPSCVLHDRETNKTWFPINESPQKCGILELDETTNQTRKLFFPELFEKKMDYRIWQIGFAKTGDDLWIACEQFLAKINLKTGKLVKIPLLIPGKTEPFALNGIAAAPDGSLWISVLNPKLNMPLLHFFPKTGKFDVFGREKGMTFSDGRRLFLDKKGRVWLCSNHTSKLGINRLDPATGKVRNFVCVQNDSLSLPHNMTFDFVEDKQGRIWIGTTNGLCFYDPADDQIHRPRSPKIEINYLALDGEGQIWATGDACIRYNPATQTWKTFDASHGIYNYHAHLYPLNDGGIGFNATIVAHPTDFTKLTTAAAVHFTDFQVFNKSLELPENIDFTKKIELPYFDNFFSVSWSALSWTNPIDDQFAYRLRGIDTGWVFLSSAVPQMASYTQILPGNYVFDVKCRNRDGVWSTPKSLEISLKPAWWQTIWFKILMVATLAAALYFLWKNRLRQVRLESEIQQNAAIFRQKEAELQQRLSEVQISALRSQMNPHFIFNSLNSINRFIQMNEPDAASNYLTKFSRLIRLVLENSRTELISLEQELTTIRLYLDMESLRFAEQFQYKIDLDPSLESSEIDLPPMLIQPYLENAIWHGLMQKNDKNRQLSLKINLFEQNKLQITVTDNGIGRTAARLLNSKSATKQKSLGMDLTAERLRLFEKTTGRKIHVFIEDLHEPNGQVAGTSVRLEMDF